MQNHKWIQKGQQLEIGFYTIIPFYLPYFCFIICLYLSFHSLFYFLFYQIQQSIRCSPIAFTVCNSAVNVNDLSGNPSAIPYVLRIIYLNYNDSPFQIHVCIYAYCHASLYGITINDLKPSQANEHSLSTREIFFFYKLTSS